MDCGGKYRTTPFGALPERRKSLTLPENNMSKSGLSVLTAYLYQLIGMSSNKEIDIGINN